MEKIKLYSDVLATWVAILGALFGGIFALVQYYNNSTAERVKVSLQYVDRFSHSPLLEARLRINAFWDGRAEEAFAKNASSEKDLAKFVIGLVHEHDLGSDIDLVAEFFEDLYACTCGKACDEELSIRFFGRYTRDFHGLLFPYVADQRRRLSDDSFGRAIELFAKTQKTQGKGQESVCKLAQPIIPPALAHKAAQGR